MGSNPRLLLPHIGLCILSWSTIVFATVQSPPTMIKQPPTDTLLFQVAVGPDEKDRPFILECEATGEPAPTYRWTKSGRIFEWQAYDDRVSQQPGRGTLVFTKPSDVDEGYYQCYATNEHGTSVSNGVFVRRSDLSSFSDDRPITKVVNEGDPLTINCAPPTGFPKPTIFWIIQSVSGALRSINNSRITVDPEGALHFSNITKYDNLDDAYYSCAASIVFRNEYKLGNKVKLQVISSGNSLSQAKHAPQEQYRSPPIITAVRGTPQEIHCIYGGTPLPEIRWKKKGGDLPLNRITMINYGKTLRIKNVDFEDEGFYECVASNGVGTAQSHAVQITVQSAPYWITAPNNTNGAEGEDVTFECKATGVPEPEIKWFVNGIPIENSTVRNPRRKIISPTTIQLERLDKTDTAVYQCNASNAIGYAFKDFYLNVLALPPEITEPPAPLYETVDGQAVTLTCRVFGAPKPHVKWIRSNKELTGGRYNILSNGDLFISKTMFADAGHYLCIATNKFGEKSSSEKVGFLEVKEKTRVTAQPVDYEVEAGKSATFRCNAVADSSLELSIDWESNGQLIDFDQDPRMFKAADYSLTISKTTELDSGTYTCIASTKLDDVKESATLIVQDVPNAPKLVAVECNRLTARVEWQSMGDNRAPILGYIIQYNTSFTPDTWENAFTLVPASDFKFEVAMSPWSNYTFRVIGRNKVGLSLPSQHSYPCSTPPDVPYKNPDNVEGRGTAPDNLVIIWTPMPSIEHNAPGFYYRVFYRLEKVGGEFQFDDVSDWRRSTWMIPNQQTFQPYRIKVEAHNSLGQANVAATEVTGYSGEDFPLEPPYNLTVREMIDANTAVLSWNPVPQESVQGHFKGYKIETWTDRETAERKRVMIVAANVTHSLVKLFVPNTENRVQVRVFNGAYDGPPSTTYTFRAPPGKPGPVGALEAIPMGQSALFLIWKRPQEPNGMLRGYRIFYQKVDGLKLGPLMERDRINNPDITRAKLAGLEPGTKYRVTVHARSDQGLGVPDFVERTTRSEGDMHTPDKPIFTWSHQNYDDGRSAIKVTWLPSMGGKPGSHFFVEYKKKDETRFRKTDDELYQTSVVIKQLEPGTTYEVRVVSVDGKEMVPSDTEEIDTEGAVYAPHMTGNVATAGWFIGMMCAIAILLLILIIVCMVKRNRGGKYSVHEKEEQRGRDADYQEEPGGFNEYAKPPPPGNYMKGSRTSISSSVKPTESDTDSMAEYGDGEGAKFTEDGSFIGQYGPKKRSEQEETSPSALATFV